MSDISNSMEAAVAAACKRGDRVPADAPTWLTSIGIAIGDIVKSSREVGSRGEKTDAVVEFESGTALNISVKLASADFWANWYGYKRIRTEFGNAVLQKICDRTAVWANERSVADNYLPYVGVSVHSPLALVELGRLLMGFSMKSKN